MGQETEMILHKVPDWVRKFRAAIASREHLAFDFDGRDCARTVASVVREYTTGPDLAAEYRSRYSDEATARAILKESPEGMLGILTGLFQRHGLAPIRPDDLAEGDIAYIHLDDFGCLSVCDQNKRLVAPGRAGLRRVSHRHAIASWRIRL